QDDVGPAGLLAGGGQLAVGQLELAVVQVVVVAVDGQHRKLLCPAGAWSMGCPPEPDNLLSRQGTVGKRRRRTAWILGRRRALLNGRGGQEGIDPAKMRRP